MKAREKRVGLDRMGTLVEATMGKGSSERRSNRRVPGVSSMTRVTCNLSFEPGLLIMKGGTTNKLSPDTRHKLGHLWANLEVWLPYVKGNCM